MDLQEKLDNLKDKAMNIGDKDLITKVSEIIGLYKAYDLTSYTNLLNEVVGRLLDLSEELIEKNPVLNAKKKYKLSEKNAEFKEFYNYLEDKGKSANTCNSYVRNISRIKRNPIFNINTMEEFNAKIDDIIEHYRVSNEINHNAHVSALSQYKMYLDSKNEESGE